MTALRKIYLQFLWDVSKFYFILIIFITTQHFL
nr:MAG TPA: hypothetical protein [Bacteriophage sp.]